MTTGSLLPLFALLALLACSTHAAAQATGPDEAVQPDGMIAPRSTLTPGQERAIYDAVSQQHIIHSIADVPAAIGAAVPQAVELRELPDQVATEAPYETPLKFAMVENDVVVVDPIGMRVIDVIRGAAKP